MATHGYVISQFELHATVKEGGMSRVRKARLVDEGINVALKGPKPGDQRMEAVESFKRELQALECMDHPNVIKLLGVATDGSERFLVLEWLEETLAERITSLGPVNWSLFYENTGRAILEALKYAHGRGFTHRDLKPWNVMLDKKSVARVTDFGIAKAIDDDSLGLTLARAKSEPWTPDDPLDQSRNHLRDVYSWAALAVACMTGRLDFTTTEELRTAARKLGATCPSELLLRCLEKDPQRRPPAVLELLWDADDFHRAQEASSKSPRVIGVELASRVHEKLPALILGPEETLVSQLLADFALPLQIFLLPEGDWEFTGQTLCVRTARPALDSPWLLLKDVWPAVQRPSSTSGVTLSTRFVERVSSEANATESRRNLDFLHGFLSTQREREEEEQKRRDEERYLNMLQEILAARSRSLRFLPELEYEDGKWEAGNYSIVVNEEHSLVPGERRVIRGTNGVIVFEVVSFAVGRIFMRPIGLVRGQPPSSGRLQADTAAQRRALDRQEGALKVLRDDGAVSPRLKHLILHPGSAGLPEQSGRPARADLSPDKAKVLDAALGAPDLMVIQGPPGTGKTRLITAMVSQYLKEQPNGRVLVAAQTHIAIDHVVEKLLSGGHQPGQIVRIARTDEDKVAPTVRPTLLQNCVAQWCISTAKRSRAHTRTRGAALGIDSDELELLVRAEALTRARENYLRLETQLTKRTQDLDSAQHEAALLSATKEEVTQVVETATVATLTVAELTVERNKIAEQLRQLRQELASLGRDGQVMSEMNPDELKEYLILSTKDDPKSADFRRHVALQVQWLDILGQLKQFEALVLKTASVVAGTCVGLASNDAFSDLRFDLCIIDEASKATATEALVPIVRSERALIVGDPKQLPPFWEEVEVEGYSETEVRETLLDYLLPRLPQKCVQELTHQYRMCKSIGDLINASFYGSLTNERPDAERPAWMQKRFPRPVLWVDTKGARDQPQGHSFVNPKEQEIVLDILSTLHDLASRAKAVASVAVIAGYAAQANALDHRIPRGHLAALEIEVATVDSFQGRESSVCIFSATLCNDREYLGFLRSTKRLNVALSRPQDLLVIVGDQDFCYRVPGENPFKKVINFIESNPKTCETVHAGK